MHDCAYRECSVQFTQKIEINLHKYRFGLRVKKMAATRDSWYCSDSANHRVQYGNRKEAMKEYIEKTPYAIHIPDSKILGAHMEPTWCRQDPGGPHVGPMKIAIWDNLTWSNVSSMTNNQTAINHVSRLFDVYNII